MYNKALDTFKAVADCRSFTKASEQLFISHTAVIKQINGLENHFGVKLFKRSNQGAILTAAGQCLYEKTLKIMQFSEKAVREIQKAHFASPRTIRVGTSLFYPCHIFMDLWDTISDRCPQYKLQIVTIENDERRLDGLNDNYDFLIGAFNTQVDEKLFDFYPIGNYRFCLAMPKKHPLAKKKSLHFQDLIGEKLLLMKSGCSAINDQIRQEIETNYPQITIEDISPHYSIRTFNQCVESNALLLSLECWNNVHPGLVSVPLDENFALPYGILASQKATIDLSEFIKALKGILESPKD